MALCVCLSNMCIIFGQYSSIIQTIFGQCFDIVWKIFFIFLYYIFEILSNMWIVLIQYLGNIWALFVQYIVYHFGSIWIKCSHCPGNICQMFRFFFRGAVQKNSIFKEIVQIGGREVTPISKNWKEMIFWQKLEREGVTKHIVKNRSTIFCMIYYSILGFSVSLSVPLTLWKW